MTIRKIVLSTTCLVAGLSVLPAQAQVKVQTAAQPFKVVELQTTAQSEPNFAKFAPGVATKRTRLDYSVWDEALENVVLDFGPSTRRRSSRPDSSVGTRFTKGHTSPYRLEGSRVTFAYFNNDYREGLTEYRKDLQSIPSRLDITKLNRNEQLAYWFNLHNVAMIEQIALHYPVDGPSRIKLRINGEKVLLDQARFIEVDGEKLSLRDIRQNIVYANWNNSDVIYGFFRGDVGSPKMPRYAYERDNVMGLLDDNAEEFVNSLRGFHESYDKRQVSAIYEEARPFYFANWTPDLTAHLLKHAVRDTVAEVNSGKPFKVARYEDDIADLTAGNGLGTSGLAISGQGLMSAETQRLLAEVGEKQQELRRMGILKPRGGYVIIEDLYTDDTSSAPPPPQIVTGETGSDNE